MKSLYLAVDFDGTVVSHEYPRIGKDIGAVPVLKKLIEKGHKLILFTMRSGRELSEAVEWFQQNDIHLFGVQYNPTQSSWTASNKCYAHVFLDDAGLGFPLKFDQEVSARPYADWVNVEALLIENKIL